MLFDESLGHPENQQKLMNAWQANRIPHALLLHGPEGCGKEAFAIGIAQLLNAADENGVIDRESSVFRKIAQFQHPDVQFIFPTPAQSNAKPEELQAALQEKAKNPYRRVTFTGKNTFIGIDTIRELKKEAGYRLYEGQKKVFIIAEAEELRPEAANALLKLLEEPPQNLKLILVTANLHKLLPTIKSRCQMLRFSPMGESQIAAIVRRFVPKVDERDLAAIIRLSGFNLKRTFEFLDKNALQNRDLAIDFLRKAILIHKSQELMALVEPLTAKKDRDDARQMLWFLLLWFQDILHINKGVKNDREIRNVDKADTLRKFIAFTPTAEINGIVREVEATIRELDDPRNLNPLLLLTHLAIRLNPLLKKA